MSMSIKDFLMYIDPKDIWGVEYQSTKFKAETLQWALENKVPWAYNCIKCTHSVLGDPKYHEWYEKGLIVGYRHRRCI